MNKKLKIKFAIAVLTVILSLVLGAYTKVMMILHFSDPFKFWLNLTLYVSSWLMLFVAAFFMGKEVVKLADEYVKKKMENTYTTTVNLEKKGQAEVKKLTKKGIHFTHHHVAKPAKKGIQLTAHHIRKTAKKGIHTTRRIHKKFLKLK